MAQDQDGVADVAIIGGSFAGVSAALYLSRARRSVVLYDHGLTRNRFAEAGHAFFGQDGRTPEAIRQAGQADLAQYPRLRRIGRAVQAITGADGAFVVTAEGQAPQQVRRVILAHGMRDILPDLPGLAECWGRTAILCPYCHGYELADRPTGVLMSGPGALHHARMLPEWAGDLVLFANGHDLPAADRADILARGIVIEDAPVVAVEERAGQVTGLRLADGRVVPRAVLYVQSRAEPSCDLPEALGCRMDDGMMGRQVAVDEMQATSVPGVWAAGDLASQMAAAFLAAASGAKAGISAHRSFLQFDPV